MIVLSCTAQLAIWSQRRVNIYLRVLDGVGERELCFHNNNRRTPDMRARTDFLQAVKFEAGLKNCSKHDIVL